MVPELISFDFLPFVISKLGGIVAICVGGFIAFMIIRVAVENWISKLESRKMIYGMIREERAMRNYRTKSFNNGRWEKGDENLYQRQNAKLKRTIYAYRTGNFHSPHRRRYYKHRSRY